MTATVPGISAPWWARWQAGLVFLLAVLAALWFFFRIRPVARWAAGITGQDNEAGGHYGFWSGFGGALPDILLITGALAFYWHLSCRASGCWLPGAHTMADGSIRVCRWHHPDIRGRKLTDSVRHELHQLHIARLTGRKSA
jgi:hypothetical protein